MFPSSFCLSGMVTLFRKLHGADVEFPYFGDVKSCFWGSVSSSRLCQASMGFRMVCRRFCNLVLVFGKLLLVGFWQYHLLPWPLNYFLPLLPQLLCSSSLQSSSFFPPQPTIGSWLSGSAPLSPLPSITTASSLPYNHFTCLTFLLLPYLFTRAGLM